jgi:transcriptional regulator with XRE-family HTH domain
MVLTQALTTPDAGVRLDAGRFRRELALRGITAGTLAHVAGVAPNTISRILAGQPISIATLRAVARALHETPVLPGMAELLADSGSGTIADTLKTPRPSRATAFEEDGAHDAEPQTEQ